MNPTTTFVLIILFFILRSIFYGNFAYAFIASIIMLYGGTRWLFSFDGQTWQDTALALQGLDGYAWNSIIFLLSIVAATAFMIKFFAGHGGDLFGNLCRELVFFWRETLQGDPQRNAIATLIKTVPRNNVYVTYCRKKDTLEIFAKTPKAYLGTAIERESRVISGKPDVVQSLIDSIPGAVAYFENNAQDCHPVLDLNDDTCVEHSDR